MTAAARKPTVNIISITLLAILIFAGGLLIMHGAKGAPLKSGSNLVITFKEPVMVDKLYGACRAYKSILLSVDDAKRFMELVEA